MKNKILLLFTLLALTEFSYCQNHETSQFKTTDLIGVWLPIYNKDNNNLVFEKKTTTEHRYGSSIEIFKNGDFYYRYSAPCGNDSMMHTQNYNGKWILDEKDWIITTTKPIKGNGTLFKIVELQANKLILVEIKSNEGNN
jgi:Lipocalin-like domain